ncbi:MAG: D-alanine--D-alanine ligase [Candidatus Dormibacteraeota bacterium]|nr:D-alanine--D-alanine ligase [Candidatus Dormibacteraeota bacterium]
MTTVGVFFGGRSVEHEVSVITALQAISAFPAARLTPVPVYIGKNGAWYTGEALASIESYRDIGRLTAGATRVTLRPDPEARGTLLPLEARRGLLGGGQRPAAQLDVALPLVHGTGGEDGTLQGLFELNDLAYCGCVVAAAALSMDKRLAKAAFRAAGLTVLDDVLVTRDAWSGGAGTVIDGIERVAGYPAYVKPLSLGSSIGVSRVETREQLRDAVELALAYDTRCLAEAAQEDIVEINCAVLGRSDDLRASACEQPKSGGLLSYEDKYLSKGGKSGAATLGAGKAASQRIVPAPLSEAMTRRVQETAIAAFRAIDAEGVARVDFLVRGEEIIVNEINTVPGSLAFHLWEPVGLSLTDVVSRLVELAEERHAAKARTAYSIDTWLLTGRPSA